MFTFVYVLFFVQFNPKFIYSFKLQIKNYLINQNVRNHKFKVDKIENFLKQRNQIVDWTQ